MSCIKVFIVALRHLNFVPTCLQVMKVKCKKFLKLNFVNHFLLSWKVGKYSVSSVKCYESWCVVISVLMRHLLKMTNCELPKFFVFRECSHQRILVKLRISQFFENNCDHIIWMNHQKGDCPFCRNLFSLLVLLIVFVLNSSNSPNLCQCFSTKTLQTGTIPRFMQSMLLRLNSQHKIFSKIIRSFLHHLFRRIEQKKLLMCIFLLDDSLTTDLALFTTSLKSGSSI